ncbi:hypothetical protein FS749_013854 [Ceratobasidium sp. UAMH 11750]|nr:hypothetical protein FS749_013854 [Ceratobasidium sp. UAMH 11750]
MEREQTLLRLNGHGTYRDLEVQHPDVVVLTHRSVSRYSSTTTIPQSNSATIVDAFFACDNGEKYVCAACGTVCLEPIRDAVDSFTSSSLELMGLLEKWRQDPALAVNLYLSCMRVSQDYDAAVEVFGNRGAYIADLKSIVQELKDAVKKAAYFPYRCGHDDLRTQILSEAPNSIKQLNRSLKSGQRKYMLKHAPAIAPTITRLLSCLKNLCKVLLNWSHGKADRVCVNRACAVLDRAFKVVVSAFYARGMDVSDIVPSSSSQLNGALQDLLAEEPSSENWKKHQLVIGAVVKKLLKSVLDLGVGDHMAVEVWWSVVGLSGQDEMNGVDTNPVDNDSGSVAAQCSAGLGTENSPGKSPSRWIMAVPTLDPVLSLKGGKRRRFPYRLLPSPTWMDLQWAFS